jgi:3-hydroxyacyl-[acyl-carrier-protein] dehydratase
MNRDEIKNILPHREPMLLVDEVEIDGNKAEGSYKVRGDEFFLQGHFPGMPVVPGVIQCEMMAQVGALVVLSREENKGKTPLFGGMDKVKFRRMVKPGDTFKVKCEITRTMGDIGFGKVEGFVDGEQACEAVVTFALFKREN